MMSHRLIVLLLAVVRRQVASLAHLSLWAEMYGVGQSTISDIKRSKPTLLNFVSVIENEDGSSSRKSMKAATNKDLENAVFMWLLQQCSVGNPISGQILCEKAKILAEKLGCSSFKASNGWIRNFKSRHGIRELDLSGEKLSANSKAADFIEKFKVVADSYSPEFLYNADETGLVWKALPKTTLASKREYSAPEHKVSKYHVTVLRCANSTVSHKIPLLLIGKSKSPRAFKNVKKLPLCYKNQPKAWMTATLFTEWYDKIFIPEVKKHQISLGKEGKVLLIVDHAPTNPTTELLERGNGQFKAIFLPPNVTNLLQPMDQSVIETMKRYYIRQLLRKLLLEGEDKEGVCENHKK
ncbi:jerky protein homolog-like [Bacillus rossius redtenbacheri]|uniref:jerky protein homolog-like n=1 Tax=Bacillus rossius redtenbacheri TaxID=93214 RepID=UPI002FDEFC0E